MSKAQERLFGGRSACGSAMANRPELEFTYTLDRPDLPAQPRRARRLQRRQVRRRLLADARAGAAAQARVHRGADRDRARTPAARSRLRLGRAARTSRATRGADGVGVALSSAQVASCRRHGLDVHLKDARDRRPRAPTGPFDAVASLGAFEHFCSPDDHRAGRQEAALPRASSRTRRACCRTAGASTCRRWCSGAT